MKNEKNPGHILGLDIGVNSIGWAIIGTSDGRPSSIVATGVRVFPFDADFERDFKAGKPASLAAPRREARLMRRMTERRARRHTKLFNMLARAGLLPAGKPEHVIPALDKEILAKYGRAGSRTLAHVLPYELRKRALDGKIEPYELGRALYHLGQRRGFLSNRKTAPKKDEDEKSVVKGGISQLAQEMNGAGARTLGEYFAGLDPTHQRIRNRYTSRGMYEDEFERIWQGQARHYPEVLTHELKKRLHKCIFHQRALKSAKGLVGTCEFEPKRRRAAWAHILSQRFRIWQQVNNTEIIDDNGEIKPLTEDQRQTLYNALDKEGDLSFTEAKKRLGLSRQCTFNFESGEEKRFVGNRTIAKLAGIFGDRWWAFSDEERDKIMHDVISIQKDATLAKRGRERWGLSEEAASEFGAVELQPDYCRLSRRAMMKLMPYLAKGARYGEAVKAVYGSPFAAEQALGALPPVSKYAAAIRNPAVTRVLSEVRKVANAIVGKYGKPDQVRIELAREMKKPAKERREIMKRNRENEKGRTKAYGRILAETNIQNPTRDDILKVLLAEECRWICPYTGRSISMTALFGSHPEFDIEHIMPFSVSLDDSFMNKTLCYVEENRSIKKNRTPYEAYSGSPAKYEEILQRVNRFQGTGREAKLWRFKQGEMNFDDFVERQLNDTKYATTQAAGYVGLLYGGVIDADHKRRVQASKGQMTAYLRNEWDLNGILGGGEKTREDHRQHAIDAICVALTDAGIVKALSDAAGRAQREGRRRFGRMEEPFEGFWDRAAESVLSINVSHRVSRKVNGPLHERTLYGPAPELDKKGNPVYHVRKSLDKLSVGEVADIVDDTVRKLVGEKLAQVGGPANKVFSNPANHPVLTTKDGRQIPIHRVRIRKAVAAQRIGHDATSRYILPGSNHHVEIFETKDEKGGIKWVGHMVTRLEAARRLARHQPIVNKEHEEGEEFLFSLAPGEMIEVDGDEGRELYVVRVTSIDKSGYITISYVRHTDARKKDVIMGRAKQSGDSTEQSGGVRGRRKPGESDWKKSMPESLKRLNCRKVLITPLGEVRRAND